MNDPPKHVEYGPDGERPAAGVDGGPAAVAAAIEGAAEFTPFDEQLSRLPRNDLGNAERLRRRFGRDLMSVRGVGWHSWTGTHWSLEGGARDAQLLAQRTAEAMVGEAAAMQAVGRRDGEEIKDFEKRVQDAYHWAIQSGNRNRLTAMLAEAAPHLQREVNETDADPLKLTVANGTLLLGAERIEGGDTHSPEPQLSQATPAPSSTSKNEGILEHAS